MGRQKAFTTVVLCGTELVSFEVGKKIKFISTPIETLELKKTVTYIQNNIVCENLLVSESVYELLNGDLKSRLKEVSTNFEKFNHVDYK
jgi:hypothetical protein